MGRIIVTEFVSLDGVMEAPGGGEDYKHAGWTFEINRGEEGNKFKLKETFDSEALLLLASVRNSCLDSALPRRSGVDPDPSGRHRIVSSCIARIGSFESRFKSRMDGLFRAVVSTGPMLTSVPLDRALNRPRLLTYRANDIHPNDRVG